MMMKLLPIALLLLIAATPAEQAADAQRRQAALEALKQKMSTTRPSGTLPRTAPLNPQQPAQPQPASPVKPADPAHENTRDTQSPLAAGWSGRVIGATVRDVVDRNSIVVSVAGHSEEMLIVGLDTSKMKEGQSVFNTAKEAPVVRISGTQQFKAKKGRPRQVLLASVIQAPEEKMSKDSTEETDSKKADRKSKKTKAEDNSTSTPSANSGKKAKHGGNDAVAGGDDGSSQKKKKKK